MFGITADQTQLLLKKIESLSEIEWKYFWKYGVRQVSELRYRPTGWAQAYRYVVKREVRQKKDGALYFYYHVFVTNDERTSLSELLEWQLQHAAEDPKIRA